MAIPTSKSTFASYCKRALGVGVIDINVSDDQVDDRIDEALEYFEKCEFIKNISLLSSLAYDSAISTLPFRSDFISLPCSSIPASNNSTNV